MFGRVANSGCAMSSPLSTTVTGLPGPGGSTRSAPTRASHHSCGSNESPDVKRKLLRLEDAVRLEFTEHAPSRQAGNRASWPHCWAGARWRAGARSGHRRRTKDRRRLRERADARSRATRTERSPATTGPAVRAAPATSACDDRAASAAAGATRTDTIATKSAAQPERVTRERLSHS